MLPSGNQHSAVYMSGERPGIATDQHRWCIDDDEVVFAFQDLDCLFHARIGQQARCVSARLPRWKDSQLVRWSPDCISGLDLAAQHFTEAKCAIGHSRTTAR